MSELLQIGHIFWYFLSSVKFSVYFGPGHQIILKTDLRKSQICPIWGQSDQIWMPNSTSLVRYRYVLVVGAQIIPASLSLAPNSVNRRELTFLVNIHVYLYCYSNYVRAGSQLGQIGFKLDKSGAL